MRVPAVVFVVSASPFDARVIARVIRQRFCRQPISPHSSATSSDVRSSLHSANLINGKPSLGRAARIAALSHAPETKKALEGVWFEES